jgi:hypothetical protein
MGAPRARGQALVEFAFVLPLLLLVLFAIVDGGRWVFSYNELSNAVRQGARAGIVEKWPDPACVGKSHEQCAKLVAEESLHGLPGSSVTVTCLPAPCTTGSVITVTGTATVTFLTPVVGQYLGPRPISAKAVMAVES